MTDVLDPRRDVDVVIPTYGERGEAVRQTLIACLQQSHPVSRIFVVDDGSPVPVAIPTDLQDRPEIHLLRLDKNQGISAARNAGIKQSKALFVACVNTQIVLGADWLNTCMEYVSSRPRVGACYTRMVPICPNRILTQWRMRFLETKFGEKSGPSSFAPGHAVLFRKETLDAVGGYDVRLRLHHEDSDICHRMWQQNWETHFIAEGWCVSMQEDAFARLASVVT